MPTPRVSRRAYLVIVLVALAVFVAGTLTWLTRADDADDVAAEHDVPALAPAPFGVSLSLGATEGHPSLGTPVRAVAEAVGPVETIELWDGGVRAGTVEVTDPNGGRAEFAWTPLRVGPHLLHARAFDADGRTAMSAPLTLRVFAPAIRDLPIQVVGGAGASPESIASQAGVDVEEVVTSSTTSATGDPIYLVNPDDLPTPADGGGPIVENPAGTSGPSLGAAADGCSVVLTVEGLDGDGVIYEASGSGSGFVEVASVKGNGTTRLDDLGPGSHAFSLAAKDQPVTGPPVAVTFGDGCKPSYWTGDATLIDGVLTVPEAAENVYLYLGVDEQPFVRVPQDPNQFLPGATHIDVAKYLPAMSGSVVRIEVWSGAAPAKKIASGEAELPDGTSVSDLVGESTQTVIATDAEKVAPNADEIAFRWATGNAQATGVFWQVLSWPAYATEESLSPAGLIAAGVAPVGEIPSGLMDGAAKGGSFTLAPSVLLGAIDQNTDDDLGLVLSPTVTLDVLKEIGASVEPGDPQAEPADGGNSGIPVIVGTKVWVRVVPMHDGQPLGASSPTVSLTKPAPTNPPTAVMNLTSSAFDAGRAGNPALANCIRVTKVPWTSGRLSPGYGTPGFDPTGIGVGGPPPTSPGAPDTSQWWLGAFYPTPGTYCLSDFPPPEDGDDDGCDAGVDLGPLDDACDAGSAVVTTVVGAIAPIYDYVATSYNQLIDLASTAISKLNPMCLSAHAADAGGADEADDVAAACEKLGKVAAKAGIAAVLAFYGLPPSLPTSEQLEAIADGRMTDVAVEMLKGLGVPCDDLQVSAEDAETAQAAGVDVPDGGVDVCREFAEQVLAEIKAQAEAQAQVTVGSISGLPAPGGPLAGFEMILEPRQFYRGPTVFIQAQPESPSTPNGAVCGVTAEGFGYGWGPASGVVARWETVSFSPESLGFDIPWTNADEDEDEPGPEIASGWSATLRLSGGVEVGLSHPLNGKLTSADCLTQTPLMLSDVEDPPLGRWVPGQGD